MSNPTRRSTLTRSQNLHIVLVQILFLIFGLAFLFGGSSRIALEIVGGDALEETVADFLGEELVTTPSLIWGAVVALTGYGLIWGFAAVGAKEPPAWHAGRNGLLALLTVLVVSAVFLVWQDSLFWPQAVISAIVGGGLAAYLLSRFGQLSYRLNLGAERLKHHEIRIFTLRNIGVVLLASLLTVLGVVYAILTDVIELPLPETEPGEFLFVTNFENYNDEWDTYPGRLSAEIIETQGGNQRLVLTAASGIQNDGGFSTLNRKFRDFDLRVTAEQLTSAPDHDNRYGVIFRYRDTNHYYAFEISGDGYYRLYKVRDATEEEQQRGEGETFVDDISVWILTTDEELSGENVYPTLIRPGDGNSITTALDATNEIRIVAKGDRFWFYVNGHHLKLCQRGDRRQSTYVFGECRSDNLTDYYEDDEYEQGLIAMSVGYTRKSDTAFPVSVAFDNILVTGPEEPDPEADQTNSFPIPTPTP